MSKDRIFSTNTSSTGGGGGTSDATAANQVTGNNSLSSIDGKTATLGQKTMSGSEPVVIASDQSTIPVTQTSQPLPIGASTSALQTTGNTSLSNIDGKLTASSITNTGTLSGISQVVLLSLTEESAASVQITGTWLGTITFEATLDGVTFFPINAVSSTTSVPQSTATINGLYRLTPAGTLSFRVNMTVYTSGTANISMRASKGTGGIFANQILPIKIDQTSPGTTNKVNIGTDGQVSTNGTIFVFSTLNSTIAQLATGATFTGTVESVISQQSYSILLRSDQNGTLTINQFIDAGGTKLIQTLTYSYISNTPFAKSGVMNGNHFQVVFQNTGGSTTTALQIDSAYGTIPSTTQLNNSPSAINEINGVVVDSNIGNASAGTQRIVLATNQPAIPITNAGLPSSLGQKTMALSQAVTIASDQSILPVMQQDVAISGNITTQNLSPTGTGTAGSFIGYTNLNSTGSISFQVTGTYTGALTPQFSNDGTNWITPADALIKNIATTVYTPTLTSGTTGLFSISLSGFLFFRIVALAAVTGTAIITMRGSSIVSIVELRNSAATIGNIGQITGSIQPGSANVNLGKAEDAPHTSGDVGVASLAVRTDILTVGTSANIDYGYIATDKYNSILIKDQTRHKRTYSTAFSVVVITGATDIMQIIGSASTTINIQKITINATATGGVAVPVLIQKRSTVNTGGTTNISTIVPHEATDAAATSVVTYYTANPSALGTTIGNIRAASILFSAAGTYGIYEFNFAERGKPIVLVGVTQALAINLGSTAISGGTAFISIEFTEE